MKSMHSLLGSAALALALAAGLSAPALAQKTTTPSNEAAADIDFGDDSSEWANDGECDDPRFTGEGSADELVDEDIRKDATDCKTAFEDGKVTLVEDTAASEDAAATDDTTTPDEVEIASPIDAIDFGDDTSEWANDGECDDPRFTGTGSADELLEADIRHDATDCKAAYEAGTVTLADESGTAANTESGDKSDLAILAERINFGDDSSEWAKDGECDDPSFSGSGMAAELTEEGRMADATDCKAAFIAGTITLGSGGSGTAAVAAFDYGGDWSKWANDGECDDLRFEGEGTDKKLLSDDTMGDATDCQTLEAEGKVSIRKVYTPEYAAGAPYDSSDIDFGDNSSDYANDDQCDDPRFQGPGAALTLLESDLMHDSADCKAAYEAGTIILNEDA